MATKVEKMVMSLLEQIVGGENLSVVSYDGERHQADELIDGFEQKDNSFEISLVDGTRFTLLVSNVREPVRHSYHAVLSDGRPVITVSAISLNEAVDRIADELTSNPSRVPYYELWKKHGCQITED